ncbi:MAG: hypothetical protein NTV34_22020, partial [Proteobacteria bacterium]|nr:hypothetical protein [Pseudomonadota bacterium]
LKIITSNDLGTNFAILLPRSCALQQIGYYEENGTLKVDRILFEHLDNVNKAAFLFHEALYKLDRARNQAVDSKKTRLAVARLFNADVAEDKRIELAVEMLMGQDLGVVSPTDFKGSIDVEIVKGGQVMGATIELTFFDSNGLEIAKERRYCVETGTARCRYTIKTTKFSRLKIVDGLLPAFSKNVTQMAVYHDNRLLTTVKGDRLWNDLYLQFVFGH